MASQRPDVSVLRVALDQAADMLGRVDGDLLDAPTPCAEWSAGELVDHLVSAPSRFAMIMRGEEPDWSAPPEHVGADREGRFRRAADELVEAWRDADGERSSPLDWQLAELAVHTWDLASTLGRSTADLDPEVAERGLAFMQAGLTADNRGSAFAPEQAWPPAADPYARIAAFAGRKVGEGRCN